MLGVLYVFYGLNLVCVIFLSTGHLSIFLRICLLSEPINIYGVLILRLDLLILGLGPTMRPISPETRRYINELGIRVEVQDTRNAAAQFNLLATERGVQEVAAALLPIE